MIVFFFANEPYKRDDILPQIFDIKNTYQIRTEK